ncbi:cobalamin biosynthesis protein [Cronbergia sp. UHCC 0137]|uniref:cobalamin biosynthesis protein n=1 Tax=Cronbergia sp. UHCC 0137 TaxID=3110239 RepID=UPI002B21611F|nr:cobalamin biosynthesis protein [Cronbergia sp. UHCC 0137]MEA5618655.1 cobalamin biosynthesis protein [Cronbergia sp. UHCC 0137]
MQLKLLYPQSFWVGIGCQKGISSQFIQESIEKVFQEYQLIQNNMTGIATIDSKTSELGLIEYCHLHNLPIKFFTAAILATVSVPNPAQITQKSVGTPSVAEASAILAASKHTSRSGTLLVPKQIMKLPEKVGMLTLAIAH